MVASVNGGHGYMGPIVAHLEEGTIGTGGANKVSKHFEQQAAKEKNARNYITYGRWHMGFMPRYTRIPIEKTISLMRAERNAPCGASRR